MKLQENLISKDNEIEHLKQQAVAKDQEIAILKQQVKERENLLETGQRQEKHQADLASKDEEIATLTKSMIDQQLVEMSLKQELKLQQERVCEMLQDNNRLSKANAVPLDDLSQLLVKQKITKTLVHLGPSQQTKEDESSKWTKEILNNRSVKQLHHQLAYDYNRKMKCVVKEKRVPCRDKRKNMAVLKYGRFQPMNKGYH